MIRYISRDPNSDQVHLWSTNPRWSHDKRKFVSSSFGGFIGRAFLSDASDSIHLFVDEYNLQPGQMIDIRDGKVVQDHSHTALYDMERGLYKYTGTTYNSITHILYQGGTDAIIVWYSGSSSPVCDPDPFNSNTLERVTS